MKNELDRLLISGNLERVETVEEDCFVYHVIITVTKKQDSENRKGCPKTQRQLCEETTTHAKYGRITEPNICQIIHE